MDYSVITASFCVLLKIEDGIYLANLVLGLLIFHFCLVVV